MKQLILFLLSLIILLNSCDFSGESNYTPGVFFVHQPVLNNQDTLDVYYTEEVGKLRMDSITVGDTISFFMHFEAYANRLSAFYLKHTPDSVVKVILPEQSALDSIFSPTSDYEKGNFLMEPSFSKLGFSFQYIALKPSMDAMLQLTVVSDAIFENGFGSSSNHFKLKTPIKASMEIVEAE